MKLHPRRRARGWRWAGYTLLEILIVLSIIALIAGTTAVALTKFLPEARIKTTRQSGIAVRSAANLYRMQHATDECPTMDLLVRAQLIDEASKTVDAWDLPFVIECDERGTHVISAGPDKKMNTPDDIRVPDAPAPVARE
jgi:general secretion pathway protein G